MDRVVSIYRGHGGPVFDVAWSPNGRWRASASRDCTVHVWEAVTGQQHLIFCGHDIYVTRVAWSPDGRLVASGAWDGDEVYLWEASSGRVVHTYREPVGAESHGLAWSPDGRYFATNDQHAIHIWRVASDTRSATYSRWEEAPDRVAWSPDGALLAHSGKRGHIYGRDAASGHIIWRCRAHTGWISALAYSPNGKFLASTSSDATVQVRDSWTGTLMTIYRGHHPGEFRSWQRPKRPQRVFSSYTNAVWGCSWSPDSQYLASASGSMLDQTHALPAPLSNTVHIWEACTGRQSYVYTSHAKAVRGVAWSPAGLSIASCGWDETVHVWRAPVPLNLTEPWQ
jgi:WD40 repeat protein